MRSKINLRDIQAIIIDIDGTLWRGNTPMFGLVGFFEFLEQRDIAFTLVTNNTVETPTQYQQKLAEFGVRVELAQILTASVATADYLTRCLKPHAPIFVIGDVGLLEALVAAGFTICQDASQPVEVVVVGGGSALTYDNLKNAILLIQAGACLVGTNPDLLVPTEEGLVPEAGTTLAAIQAATGISPAIIGKPERLLFDIAIQKMGSLPTQTAMVGDRLDTDILGGQRAGLRTILVTTGVDSEKTIPQKGIQPEAVFSGLAELKDEWQSQMKFQKP